MAIVSYRLYCSDCTNERVIQKRDLDVSQWVVLSLPSHEGLCPACNDAVDPNEEQYRKCHEEVSFEELDNIGETGGENLRKKGIVTRQDVKNASDEEILETPWVGDAGLKSIRRRVR